MGDAFNQKDNTRESKHVATDIRQMSPRSHEVRFREPALNTEFNRENKKLRIICEFHAKGWCIKGSSCRFLHIKDGLGPMVNKNEPLEKRQASSSSVASHDNHYISGLSAFRNTDLPYSLRSSDLPYSLSRRTFSLGSSSKNRLSSNCWEPSVAFRPSHPITQNLLMKEILYDPIRDIEKKSVEDLQVRTSHSDQGSSIKNVKLLDTVKDNNNNNKILSSVRGNKREESDGHKANESKALKYFQAELVEFVKELVKPTWHEGLLSREAHKLVVKKAVDKVISTLQPQKIPSTDGSIKSYLSSSRPKIANLVEAYIKKYGKT